MATELICFFLLGIAALLLNAGLSSQALPLFWLILPLGIKISLNAIQIRAAKNSQKGSAQEVVTQCSAIHIRFWYQWDSSSSAYSFMYCFRSLKTRKAKDISLTELKCMGFNYVQRNSLDKYIQGKIKAGMKYLITRHDGEEDDIASQDFDNYDKAN